MGKQEVLRGPKRTVWVILCCKIYNVALDIGVDRLDASVFR